jgi:hypothetical protein
MAWEGGTTEQLLEALLGAHGEEAEADAAEHFENCLAGVYTPKIQAEAEELDQALDTYVEQGGATGEQLAAEGGLQPIDEVDEDAGDVDPDELAEAEERMTQRAEEADSVGLIDAELERLQKHVGRSLLDKEVDEILGRIPADITTGDGESLDLVRDHGERLKGALDNHDDRMEIAAAAARRVQVEAEDGEVALPRDRRQGRVEAARAAMRKDPEISTGLDSLAEGMSEQEHYALRGEVAAEAAMELAEADR